MSAEHMGMVFKAEGIKGPEKLLLLALTNWTDPYGYCWPGEKRLAADSGTSVSTVQRSKRKLMQMGLYKTLRRTSKNGTPITNLSRVNLPKLASMARREVAYDDNLIGLEFEFEDDTQGDPEQTLADTPQGDAEDAGQADDTRSELLKRQSDGYLPSDCGVLPSNLTGTSRQSAGQSLTDPEVISEGTIAPPSSARSAPDVPEGPCVGSRDAARERATGGDAAPKKPSKSKKGTFGNLPLLAPRIDMGPIREAVPPDLAALLPQPWPKVIATCVAIALEGGPTVGHERTIEQVATRVASRWYTHGYAQAVLEGQPIRRPVGVLRALIAPPECTAPRCEDGEDIDTGAVCRTCVERDADRAASRTPLRAV